MWKQRREKAKQQYLSFFDRSKSYNDLSSKPYLKKAFEVHLLNYQKKNASILRVFKSLSGRVEYKLKGSIQMTNSPVNKKGTYFIWTDESEKSSTFTGSWSRKGFKLIDAKLSSYAFHYYDIGEFSKITNPEIIAALLQNKASQYRIGHDRWYEYGNSAYCFSNSILRCDYSGKKQKKTDYFVMKPFYSKVAKGAFGVGKEPKYSFSYQDKKLSKLIKQKFVKTILNPRVRVRKEEKHFHSYLEEFHRGDKRYDLIIRKSKSGKTKCHFPQEHAGFELTDIDYTTQELLDDMISLCEHLKFLHETLKIKHADLKFNNVMKNHNLRIIDFGKAKDVNDNLARGVALFSTPEQFFIKFSKFRNSILSSSQDLKISLNGKMDVFSVGVLMLQLLMKKQGEDIWKREDMALYLNDLNTVREYEASAEKSSFDLRLFSDWKQVAIRSLNRSKRSLDHIISSTVKEYVLNVNDIPEAIKSNYRAKLTEILIQATIPFSNQRLSAGEMKDKMVELRELLNLSHQEKMRNEANPIRKV